MAGMLPGVECARRRRFHQGGGLSDTSWSASATRTSRRPSFSLRSESNYNYISSLQRMLMKKEQENEKLGGVAREAKQRLDDKLVRRHRKSEAKRGKAKENFNYVDGRRVVAGELRTEVFGAKKGGSKRLFSWSKLGWKGLEEEDCAICLERFRGGQTLVHLACAHRFHTRCLVPWLVTNSFCPCCRKEINSK